MPEVATGLNPIFMDKMQIAQWIVTFIVGSIAAFAALITAWKAIREVAANRIVRKADLDWRRVSLARDLIERLEDNPYGQGAFRMLDLTATDIPTRNHGTLYVTEKEITHSLNAGQGPFNPEDLPIRACFDALLETLEHWEHYIRIGLIKFEDVQYPVNYYVNKLAVREPVRKYMNEFGYQLATSFVNRFHQ